MLNRRDLISGTTSLGLLSTFPNTEKKEQQLKEFDFSGCGWGDFTYLYKSKRTAYKVPIGVVYYVDIKASKVIATFDRFGGCSCEFWKCDSYIIKEKCDCGFDNKDRYFTLDFRFVYEDYQTNTDFGLKVLSDLRHVYLGSLKTELNFTELNFRDYCASGILYTSRIRQALKMEPLIRDHPIGKTDPFAGLPTWI